MTSNRIRVGWGLLNDLDKFTIAGVRRRPDGTYTTRCKPGNETVFTAKVVDMATNKPLGRPRLATGRKDAVAYIRMTVEQKNRLERLGGAKWVRRMIDKAGGA